MSDARGKDAGGIPAVPAATGFYVSAVKAALDRLVAAFLLLALLPLLATAAAAVAIDSRGGVFFLQERVGLCGRSFRMVKFRTMVPGAQQMGTGLLVTRGDARVTRVGRWLRSTSLDELPQLWNVVRGEMSLVGPRPTLAEQVVRYTDYQRQRLRLRPGMTGLAQVSGRKSLSWEERIHLDVRYLRTVSAWTDLRILFRTILVVLGAKDPEAREDYWRALEDRKTSESRESESDTATDHGLAPGRHADREVRDSV